MSRTFLAVLHFDGGEFVGWQRQPDGRSVQGEIERVLKRLTGVRLPVHAAGRTDAGVHAVGLGASFEAPDRWGAADLRRALNALLPTDCWVASIHQMADGFHARKCALRRRYRYDVGTDDAAQSPFRRRYEWAVVQGVDEPALRTAAAAIQGQHNFIAFAAKGTPQRHFRCDIERTEWVPRPGGAGFSFHVEADRFLYHMVRMLVGTMVDIATGRRAPGDMERLLASSDNLGTSPPAPPQGLFFVGADYEARWFLEDRA